MPELLRLLRALPAPVRFLGSFFILLPVVFLLARALGMGNKAWLFILGLLVILLVLALFNGLVKAREKRRAKQFEGNLALQSREAGVGKEEIREALAELSEKWQVAVTQLREAGLSIYDLPWYLLIGEPQSGKSTTLESSGIEFPVGREALSGAGGTRNCDWWFSNEAVILDTAGRFTFQEESAPDKHEWTAFLRLLHRYRRYCPINGVIVVIPATSLTEDAPDEIERKAKNIRDKLRHLQKTLDIRFPVYILVTKADRILGFSEFFSQIDPVDQRQLFGWSEGDVKEQPWDPKRFSEIFEGMVNRVHKYRLRFLNQESNVSQVDKLFVFPEELAAVGEPLAAYLHTIFAASRFEEPFIFRGFYITSGVQQGRPIARACRDLLRVQVGDPQGVLEDLESVFRQSRAFFIRDFYEKKLFREPGLVSRTRAALKRDRVYEWVFRGLMAATVLVALLLLLPAAVNLFRVLKPIRASVERAERCLKADQPCTIEESFDLIYDLERQKRGLSESRWTLRFLLRGSQRNEISAELLPAIQGRLLRDGVLVPLLVSFEERAGRLDWADHPDLYPDFFDAFQQLVRFRELFRATSTESLDALHADLTIGSMVTVCRAAKGLDASPAGQAIDHWLEGTIEAAEVDAIFRSVVRAHPEEVTVTAPVPANVLRAFNDYWSIRNLARWDWTLVEQYFRQYMELSRSLTDIRPGLDYLGEFARLGTSFADNWQAGTAHLQNPPQATAGNRPGRTPTEWVASCTADFELLLGISDKLANRSDVGRLCDIIPGEWTRLTEERGRYAYLYQEKEAEGITSIGWSDAARSFAEPIVTLAGLATPDAIRQAEEGFRQVLESRLGDRERLDAITRFTADGEAKLLGPAEDLEQLEIASPPRQLEVPAMARTLREVAAVALALEVLPPARAFLNERLSDSCADCFNLDHARSYVPAANGVLSWARKRAQPALSHDNVAQELNELDDAVYHYLAEFVERERAAMGGGTPGGFVRPTRAASADSWRDLIREISRWQPVSEGRAAVSRSGGLTVAALRDFAQDNDRLRPLVRELERAQSASAASTAAPRLSSDLMDAVERFRKCIRSLDEEALRAWKQLARGQDASLDDFHAFSSSRLLRDNAQGQWLARNVEDHAAQLIAKEIRPDFSSRFSQMWRSVDRCCSNRFPFITEDTLRQQQQDYERGYERRGASTLWLNQVVDSGRREVINAMILETVSLDDMDELLFRGGGVDLLFEDFALEPIVSGAETAIDFVGGAKAKLATMRRWQRFLFGAEAAGGHGDAAADRELSARLLKWGGSQRGVFLGERMGQVDVFGPNHFRPSTDAQTGRVLTIPQRLDDRTISIVGINEDRAGWSGRLEIRGGPLKLFYFAEMASSKRPRQDDEIWTVLVQLPDFEAPQRILEGELELSFDRSLPGVFSDLDHNE